MIGGLLSEDPHVAFLVESLYEDSGDEAIQLKCPLIVVGFTNRSGSNWLCSELFRRGLTGDPDADVLFERLNIAGVRGLLKGRKALGVRDLFAELSARVSGRHRALTIKLNPSQLVWFVESGLWRQLRPEPLLVLNFRSDLVAQATSWVAAQASGDWLNGVAPADHCPPVTDRDIVHVSSAALMLTGGQGVLKLARQVYGLPGPDVTYEEMVKNFPRSVEILCAGVERDLGLGSWTEPLLEPVVGVGVSHSSFRQELEVAYRATMRGVVNDLV